MSSVESSDMRLLITGGAGFIGRALAAALADEVEVVLLDSLHPDVHGDDPHSPSIPGVRFVRDDVTSSDSWSRILAEFSPTVVVHLAAETGTAISLSQGSRHAHVNVVGTTTMLDAMFAAPRRPDHIVLASSRAVYGEGAWSSAGQTFCADPRTHDDLEAGRWDPTGPDGAAATPVPSAADLTDPRPTNIYGATKLAQEHLMRAWVASTGTSLSILRLQNVYGPGQSLINPYTGILALFARLAVRGETIDLYEDGQALRDFVYIDDVVQAVLKALASPPGPARTLDIGSGSANTLERVAKTLAGRQGAPDPIVSGRYREGDVRAASCLIDAADCEIGYRPEIDLEQGLDALLDWVRAEVGIGEPLS
jgi:dTDP-L-rhamnose 4-epimerase